METLTQVSKEVNRILGEGISILPNSPIHERLNRAIKAEITIDEKIRLLNIANKYRADIPRLMDVYENVKNRGDIYATDLRELNSIGLPTCSFKEIFKDKP